MDGTIYVGSNDGNIYALTDNGTSATLKWQYPTGSSISSSPAIGADGTIYCTALSLYAFDPATGRLKWKQAAVNGLRSSPAIGADGTIYAGANDNYLYALNSADGSVIWRYATGGWIFSSPALVPTERSTSVQPTAISTRLRNRSR